MLIPDIRILALCLMTMPGAALADLCHCLSRALGGHEMFRISSASMAPAMPTGERQRATRVDHADHTPMRATIAGFDHPVRRGEAHVFRIPGLPGDTVQMRAARVVLNGAELEQAETDPFPQVAIPGAPCPGTALPPCDIPRLTETLPDGTRYDVLRLAASSLDDTPATTVPPRHVLVLGNHRDNANDGRTTRVVGGPDPITVRNITGAFID